MDTSSKKNAHLFHKNPARPVRSQSLKVGHPSPEEARPCCGELKVFLGALSFVYFAKALAEGYLKSTITQIERRFDISSSLVGIIDGSFEIGNLLVITFVSYFGAKLHRPKIIGAGCLVMGVGTMLITAPQFFMEKYSYEKYEKYSPSSNLTPNISPCHLESSNLSPSSVMGKSQNKINDECEGDTSSSMWVYVFLGNLLRGLGETPIQPLGIAYLDDFASEDNAAFYIGNAHLIQHEKWGTCAPFPSIPNLAWKVFVLSLHAFFHSAITCLKYTKDLNSEGTSLISVCCTRKKTPY